MIRAAIAGLLVGVIGLSISPSGHRAAQAVAWRRKGPPAARVYKCAVARHRSAGGRTAQKKRQHDDHQSCVRRRPGEGSTARLQKRANNLDRAGRAFLRSKRSARHRRDPQGSGNTGRLDRHVRSSDQNSVPANVHRLENFYLSNGVGKPVQQGEHFRGLLKNVDLKGNAELGHISVTAYPSIHAQVLRDILAANIRCRQS
jgi:hypothetical protein